MIYIIKKNDIAIAEYVTKLHQDLNYNKSVLQTFSLLLSCFYWTEI